MPKELPHDENCCPPLSRAPLSQQEATRIAGAFKALSDPVRLRLLSLIASSGNEMCVCDLSSAFELSGPTISHHLKTLRTAGLIDCERRGTWVYYWVKPELLGMLAGILGAEPVPTPA